MASTRRKWHDGLEKDHRRLAAKLLLMVIFSFCVDDDARNTFTTWDRAIEMKWDCLPYQSAIKNAGPFLIKYKN